MKTARVAVSGVIHAGPPGSAANAGATVPQLTIVAHIAPDEWSQAPGIGAAADKAAPCDAPAWQSVRAPRSWG